MTTAPNTRIESEIAQVADFSAVRYAQSWEDPETLRGALAPNEDSRILSIAAAGDNSFALLAYGAGHVVSVDMSPAQCALVELKRAAMLTLTHEELLRFLGATETTAADRNQLYQRTRTELPATARAYWDANQALVERGVIHVGKLEGMWRTFRTRVLPALHSRGTTQSLFTQRAAAERAEFWDGTWANLRWRLAMRTFFSPTVIGRLGRDPSFFEHVQINAQEHYARRARHAGVELDPSTNPFLQYILLGRYLDLEHGHPYLSPAGFELIRERLDRLEVCCAELEGHVANCDPGTYTGCNLSDIFEWMSDELHEQVYRAIVRATAPGATIAYWNNLVPRSAPRSLVDTGAILPDPELARRLHDADRAFLYRAIHVDRVIHPEGAA